MHGLLSAIVGGFVVCPRPTSRLSPPPAASRTLVLLTHEDDLARKWNDILRWLDDPASVRVVVVQRPTDPWVHRMGTFLVPRGAQGTLEFWNLSFFQQCLLPSLSEAIPGFGPLVVVNGRVYPGHLSPHPETRKAVRRQWLRGLLSRVRPELVLWTRTSGLTLEDVVHACGEAGPWHSQDDGDDAGRLLRLAVRLDGMSEGGGTHPQQWMNLWWQRSLPPYLAVWLHVPPFGSHTSSVEGYPPVEMPPGVAARFTITVVWPQEEEDPPDPSQSPMWTFIGMMGAAGAHIVLLCRGTGSRPRLFRDALRGYAFHRLTVCYQPATAHSLDRSPVEDLRGATLAQGGAFVCPGRW